MIRQSSDTGLFGGVRRSDPETSRAAARSINVTHLERIVARAIWEQWDHGASWFELEGLTGLERQTISPRFAPLVRKGLIKDSGWKEPGPSGRKQIVWIATLLCDELFRR